MPRSAEATPARYRSSPATIVLRSLALLALLITSLTAWPVAAAPAEVRHFPETDRTVRGRFLEYWEANGGLAQQGYPISDEFDEINPVDGKTYRVQYFERARFEYHPEHAAPYDVLLGLLGREQYQAKYPGGRPPTNLEGRPDYCFVQTQRCVAEPFLSYWRANGGLAQQGYPISDQFAEVSPTNGQTYQVQYFERARFEHHPENAGTPFVVLLGLLGREQAREEYPAGFPWGWTLAPLADGTTYTAPNGLFEVRLPLGWTTALITNDGTVRLQHPGEATSCRIVITGPDPEMNLADLDERMRLQQYQMPNYVHLDKERVLVQGVPTYRRSYTADFGASGTLQVSEVYGVSGQYAVIANCTAPPDRFATWAPTFAGISGSVRLLAVAQPLPSAP